MIDADTANRFWAKVSEDGPTMPHMDTPCWVWAASKKVNGYGQFMLPGKRNMQAHRVAYIMAYGDIPDGLHVCHACDNPACVRADHLFLGTPKENAEDCTKKGRRPKLPPEVKRERQVESRKEYWERNRDRMIEAQKQYREQNKDRERERKIEWYKKNKERVQAQQREYRETRDLLPTQQRAKMKPVRSLRVPEDMYTIIERMADDTNRSINDVVVQLIREGLRAATAQARGD